MARIVATKFVNSGVFYGILIYLEFVKDGATTGVNANKYIYINIHECDGKRSCINVRYLPNEIYLYEINRGLIQHAQGHILVSNSTNQATNSSCFKQLKNVLN
jgi:hypothetical protein